MLQQSLCVVFRNEKVGLWARQPLAHGPYHRGKLFPICRVQGVIIRQARTTWKGCWIKVGLTAKQELGNAFRLPNFGTARLKSPGLGGDRLTREKLLEGGQTLSSTVKSTVVANRPHNSIMPCERVEGVPRPMRRVVDWVAPPPGGGRVAERGTAALHDWLESDARSGLASAATRVGGESCGRGPLQPSASCAALRWCCRDRVDGPGRVGSSSCGPPWPS